jgi:hypothetical protein
MTYDTARDRLVVHGGSDLPDETLEWDRRSWHSAGATGPGPRGHHAMIYDPARKQTVLFGNNDDAPTRDTWGWDGRIWKKLDSEGPPPRGVFGAAFDAKRNVVILFGGYGCCGAGVLGDTWEWNAQRWVQIATANAPSPRYDSSMAYDPVRNRVVLFGGRNRATSFGDTWEYDGRTWTKLDVTGPSARNGHAMVYDPRANAILLFGGRISESVYLNDFWMFDGVWKQITIPAR